MNPLRFIVEAREEIDAIYDDYESRSAGLGDRFLDQLTIQANRITHNPHLYGIVRGAVRAAMIPRFPHIIYYRIDTNETIVLAVLHYRQSSRTWWVRRSRLF
ncbi:type II toxin-antitoxin system RelE/ParE family toxin [Zavarzinella formosa]|uniref:type II toxin-antitoxin system RelE/ParE family toxin n=1 Tax=Zavarzinella formosa TaxID=360055 RepID=UPI000374FE82|nr:type II toxin-antitoxin system RelE/ParE family toxin [Zavarzinella formosa]